MIKRLSSLFVFFQFVSHSHCQQLLASLWYEGLPGFRRRHAVIQILITSIVGLLFPVFSVAYLLLPRSSIGRIMRQPFIKFICHSISYIFFLSTNVFCSIRLLNIVLLLICLVLLFVVSLRIDFEKIFSDGEVSNERRGPPPNPVELAVGCEIIRFILCIIFTVDHDLCCWIYLG